MFKLCIRNSNRRVLSILLALWVYTYAFFYFVPLIVPSTAILMYIWLVIIDILILVITRSLSNRLFEFLIIYLTIALVNILVVSYKYYVAIEAFSGMAVFLPALLIISSSLFNLNDFLKIWYKFAIVATIFSPLAIILVQNKVIDYGVFTYLNLPNSIIFAYTILCTGKENIKKRVSLILAVANFFIILAFGGRMAAFSAAFSIFLAYMLSVYVEPIKKILIMLLIGITGIAILINLDAVLQDAQIFLNRYKLNSRSLTLLLEQTRTSGAGIYLTRRNIIYEEIFEYIKNRAGFPGGFGVSLNVSNGKFYHPHNLFLQLAVMFGIIGEMLIFFLLLYRLIKIKKNKMAYEYQFTLLVLIEYLVLSITGGSILNNFLAIIGVGMVFFYKGKKQAMVKL